MTLVAAPPPQCPSMPSPTSLPNGVAAPSPPPPCSGCIKLHADIKQNMQQMMDKFDLIYMRLESLMNEKEKSRLIVSQDHEMSESGSDEKDVPSPADSRASPNTTQQGSRKRKPNKDTVHRVADDAPTLATAAVSEAPAVSATPSTPVSTTSSGFAESMGFLSSQIMDPLTQQQQLLQFIMQQSLGAAAAASGQQQQQHTSSAPPTSTPQSLPPSSTMTPSGQQQQQQQQQQQIKSEQQQPTDSSFMDQLHQQFKEKFDDDESNASVSRCSNCMTTKTTAWRRDMAGKLVCNACGLYFRLHRTHRPVHMRKDFIQQRFRRKTKEEEVNSPSAMLNSLFGMSQLAAAGGNATPAFSFLEQFNHLNSVQEQLNSTAPV